MRRVGRAGLTVTNRMAVLRRWIRLLPLMVICVGGLVAAVGGQASHGMRAAMVGLALAAAAGVFMARRKLHGSVDYRPPGGLLVFGTLLGLALYWTLNSAPEIAWDVFSSTASGGLLAYMVTSPRLRV